MLTLFTPAYLNVSSNPRGRGEQSLTFQCQYWSRDHVGLENGLETGLVTLGSVTFWPQNSLETCSRPFWSQKRSRDPVSSLSGGEHILPPDPQYI